MASESYKKWVIIALSLIVLGIVISAITGSSYRTEKPADSGFKRAPVTGPLTDSGMGKILPLEQLGVDLENPEALASLGDKYFENNRFEQAIKIYKKALELNPNDVDTYNDMGLAIHYTGNSESAIETLRKGAKIKPSYQRIWLSLGFVLTSIDKNKEAKRALQKAIELNPGSEVGLEAKRIMGLLK